MTRYSIAPALLSTLLPATACGGTLRGGQAVRLSAEFCDALHAGDLRHAGESAHGALIERDADKLDDASAPLATWLRDQPCITSVDVPSMVIETYPAIREIAVTLAADRDGVVRSCHADLTLAVGGRVGMHPTSWTSTNPDTRCTPVP